MLVRGFDAFSLGVRRGSALIKNRRPSSSMTLAMCPPLPPLSFCANNGAGNDANKMAQSASVARISRVLLAVRSIIHALRKANCAYGAYYSTHSFQQGRVLVNVPFVLVLSPG